ncbi:MAG: PAS domain S-box protein [Actinomycetota bacterium]
MSSPLGYDSNLARPIEAKAAIQQPLRERQFQILFETALDAVAIVNDQGRYLDVNSAACKLLDLEKDKLLGRCISDFAEPGFNFQQICQEFQQQEKVRGEFRLVRTDGEIRIVEYAMTANFLPHCHLLVMRDLTPCKQAKAQVQELKRQLAQTQAQLQEAGIESVRKLIPTESHRLEQIARHIPGVIYQFRLRPDGTSHFPYSSEGLQEIYGLTPEEVREDASKVFTTIHPDDLERVSQSILESAEHLTPWYCEYRVSLTDGRMLWLVGHATPQRQLDGSTVWHGYIRDITDSKKTEADNQRLLAILENTSDLIGTADVTGKALYLNRAWRNLLENDEAKLANLEIPTFHPKWALDIVLNQGLPEAMRSGIWCGETAILDLTGREIPVSQVILAHKSTDGNVEYFSTILRDIAASKATELALRKSENKFRSIIENINDIVYIINPDRSFSYISPQFNEIRGAELTDLSDHSFSNGIYPEDVPICVDAIARSLQGEKVRGVEYRVLHRDGNYYWHSSNLSALRDDEGNVIACLGIARYIHDKKQAEIALQESNSRWQLAIEGAGDGTWDWNLKTNEVIFSRQWKAMLGYEERELPNALEEWNSRVHPEDKAQCYEDFSKHLKGETSTYRNEHRLRCKDGSYKWILDRGQVIEWDPEGQPLRFIGTHCDISDRKQAEIAREELTQHLEEAQRVAQIGNWSFDLATQKLNWSTELFRIFGMTPEQGEPEFENLIEKYYINDRDLFLSSIKTAIEQGIPQYFDIRIYRSDGAIRYINNRMEIKRQDGKIVGLFGTVMDITDRKEAETQLHEISERLSLALKSGKIGCWEWDIVQNNLFWDERMYELYGVTKNTDSRLVYDIWATKLHPDDRKATETLGRQAALGKAELDDEFRVIHPDGSIHFIKAFGLLRRDAKGNPQKIIGINFDITDRKRAEVELKQAKAELEETEKFLRSIYEGVGSLIFVVDVLEHQELIYAGWSLSTEKATGIKAADIMGKMPEAIFGLTEGAAVRQNYLQCIQAGTSISYEECLTFNEQKTWWLTTLNPIKNSEDRICRIVGTTIEITERKRQEQALLLIVEGTAAKTGEAFFKSCVQYLAQVLEVRYALIAEFVDSEKLSAKTLAFWAGDSFGDNFTYSLAGTPCKNVVSKAEVCRYPNSVQSLFPEDGDLVAIQAESYAGLSIIDSAGNHLGLLAVLDTKPMLKDLEMQSAILKIFATRAGAELERIKAEAAVRQSEIQLRKQTQELEITLKKLQNTQAQLIQAEKMSSLGQLVAGVAHEINNPVSFIYSNIEPAADYARDLIELIQLYQCHYPNPPQAIDKFLEKMEFEYLASDFSKLLESMKNGATRISDIVKSLRTFSRLDEAELKEIDIHENIESTLVILQNRLNGRSGIPEIHLTKNYGQLPLVECYGGLLNQVFMNLLVNAIDAIEQRRKSLGNLENLDDIDQIKIATFMSSENQVVISISDNGCGMSPQVQEKIFNPFFTTKPIGKGTGMGLAISYQIVTENHQGHLRCLSTPGKGTEFRIELPIRQN